MKFIYLILSYGKILINKKIWVIYMMNVIRIIISIIPVVIFFLMTVFMIKSLGKDIKKSENKNKNNRNI